MAKRHTIQTVGEMVAKIAENVTTVREAVDDLKSI
jgi:hypothetical protein